MQYLRVGAAALNQTPLDWTGNVDRILKTIAKAEENGVQVLVLPELAISGYGCDDAFFSLETLHHCEESLSKILQSSPNLLLLVGLPILYGNRLYNVAAFIYRSKIIGINVKKILPREGVHYEARWFSPWPTGSVAEITLCGQKVPIGDISYQAGEIGIGVEICEEAWGAGNVNLPHLYNGLHLVLNPSASHFGFSRYGTRKQLVSERSRAMQVFYAYANMVGLEAGKIIYDGSLLIADRGKVVRVGRRFSMEESELICADLDLDLIRSSQVRVRGLACHEGDGYRERGVAIPVPDYKWSPTSRAMDIANLPDETPLKKEEEFILSVTLGLKDYLRKTGAQGFVVSLSGGSDSALVTYLVAQMFALGLDHFGPDGLAAHLGLAKPKNDPSSYKNWVAEYLTCIYQRSEFSSEITEAAAQVVAESLGANFHAVSITDLVDSYVALGSQVLERALQWETDDLTLQNIQARVRAPLPWLIANAKNSILLTTGNRSEMALGYCTMDGDSAGGLAPIAGVDKDFIRTFLRWAESHCSLGFGPLSSLKFVNAQLPTAELRPGHDQTDEADLMPYDLLESIEELLIRDKRTHQDVVRVLKSLYPSYEINYLEAQVNKFDRLFKRNQWKRERMAVSFHLDDMSLDPKSWCRYPVISK